jgi:hypothetical protein
MTHCNQCFDRIESVVGQIAKFVNVLVADDNNIAVVSREFEHGFFEL